MVLLGIHAIFYFAIWRELVYLFVCPYGDAFFSSL